jgi:hypothetical protein
VQRVIARFGTFLQAVLDVVADVVVHLARCRSSCPPNAPVAARTASGAAAITATTPTKMSDLRSVSHRSM